MTPIDDLIQRVHEFLVDPMGAVFISILSLLVALGALYYNRRQARIAELAVAGDISSRRSKFPFDRLSTENLDEEKIQAQLQLPGSAIPYVRRLPDDEYERFRSNWFSVLDRTETPRLLVKGVSGIGKTREVIELIKDYDSKLPDEQKLTILMPRGDFDVPQEPPDDLRLNNLLLLVSDVHLFQPKSTEQEVTSGEVRFRARSFLTRLSQVIDYFEERCQGYSPLRVVAITRSEPGLWDRIHPDAPLWQTFEISNLPPLHYDCVPEVTIGILQYLQLDAEDGVSDILARINDGTFNKLILCLATEKNKGKRKITKKDALENFPEIYRKDWENTFLQLIAQHPDQVKVFEAFDVLAQARVPFYTILVEELAARLWEIHYPLWIRRVKVRRAIEKMPWITKGKHFLGCPERGFEGQAPLDENLTVLVATVIRHIPRRAPELELMNVAANLTTQIPDAQALKIWKSLAKVYPNEPFIHEGLSQIFFWRGELGKALLESAKTLELDPSYKIAYCSRGDILSVMGKHKAAEKFYKAAVAMSDQEDYATSWILFERAQNLEDLGKLGQAMEYYEKIFKIYPKYISARCALAYRYNKIGSVWEAKYHLDAATKLHTEWPTTLANVARLHLAFGNYNDVAEILTKVITFRDYPELIAYIPYLIRGIAYVAQGMHDSARKDFTQAARLAFRAVRKSRRNRLALSWLTIALVALRKRSANAGLAYILRVDSPAQEVEMLFDVFHILHDEDPHPSYAKAVQILEQKILAAPWGTPPVPRVLGLLYHRDIFAKIKSTKVPPAKTLLARFAHLGSELATQQVEVESDGIRALMRGVQDFQLVEVDGKPIEGLAELLNQGIVETWRHVKYVYETAPIHKPKQEEVDESRASKEIEVEAGALQATFTDDQTLVALSIGEEPSEQLIEVINQALEKSFMLTGRKLLGID